MAYATDSDLLAIVPDASAIDSGVRALALADAAAAINDIAFGLLARRAHVYLTAHFLAVTTGSLGGDSPAVTSRRAGEISASYAVGTAATHDLGSTKWGRQFLAIKNMVPHSPVAV